MGLFVLAWLFGEGIITYRSAKELHMPPPPRQLLVASGLFAGLAIISEYGPARPVVTAFAWAVDIAVLMQVLPGTGLPTAVTSGASGRWAGIGLAGNTVILPDGTANSTGMDTSSSATATNGLGTSAAGGAAGGSAAANQAVAKQIIASNPQFSGWDTGSEWSALVSLWNRESGWSTTAQNPNSYAFGIPQSLHGTKGNEFNSSDPEGLTSAQLAAANQGNASAQILWGLNYILATYGTPSGAEKHEQSIGWY